MAEEHDSWLSGIGVSVTNFLGNAAQTVEDAASSAYNSATQTVTSAAQTVSTAAQTVYQAGAGAVEKGEEAVSSAWNAAKEYGSKAVQTASSAGSTIVEGAKKTASAGWDTAKEVGEDVVEGAEEVGEAVADGAETVVDEVEDAASDAWDTAKEVGQDIADGAGEVVEDVEEGASAAWNKAKEVGGEIVDGAEEVIDDVEDAASDLYQKGKKLVDEAVKVATDPDQWSGVGTPVRKALEEEAAQGHKVDARGLSSGELSDAKVIFGDSIDYSKVVVDGGSIASLKASRTIGNSIHLTPDLFEPDSTETTAEGKRILVHELTHVWQYQHQGWTYAPKALWAQAKAAVKGDRNGAYDWTRLIGTPWEDWNPEAQAEAVEDYNRALHNVNDGKGTRKDYDNLALLQEYVEKLVAGPA